MGEKRTMTMIGKGPAGARAAGGLDFARLETLDGYFAEKIAEGRMQGASYLLVKDGEEAACRAFGRMTCRPDSGELTTDAIAEIHDLTRLFTATAVMQLADAGRLGLHQRAADFVKEFDHPYYRDITIFHLLTHTSGLRGNARAYGEPNPWPDFVFQTNFREKGIHTILAGRVAGKPGEETVPCHGGYAVLGLVVEKVSGMPFEEYVTREILEPMNLQDTMFVVPESHRERVSIAFDWQMWTLFGSDSRMPRAHLGMLSSLRDLAAFGQMMLNEGRHEGKEILSPHAVRLMTTNRVQGVRERNGENRRGDVRVGFGWTLMNDDDKPFGPAAYYSVTPQCGLFVDPGERLVYASFTPNSEWNSVETGDLPRAVVWSALSPVNQKEGGTDGSGRVAVDRTVQRLDALFGESVAEGTLQGAGYILQAGGGEASSRTNMQGRRHYRDAKPMSADAIFPMTAMTKLMTAVAVIQLAEDGKTLLNRAVKDVIPEFDTPIHREITILQLLRHTSGLQPDPGFDGEPDPIGWWECRSLYEGGFDRKPDPHPWIKAALTGPLYAEPGAQRAYATSGYAILGEIVARLSGMSYETYVQQRILEPLGMSDTCFDVPEAAMDRLCIVDEWQELLLLNKPAQINDIPRSGAGAYTSLEDLLKLGRMLMQGGTLDGRRILGRKWVEWLENNDWFGIPGLLVNRRPADDFPFGGRYPIRQHPFPLPYGHDVCIGCAIVADRASGFVAALATPSSVDWSPEPLQRAKNILLSGLL